jgi:hypothetical protein
MNWSDIAASQPALGEVAQRLLIAPGVLLIGTRRKDGSARISGVEPLVMDGTLWLSMMQRSAKELDLRRDPRILLHSVISGREPAPEMKVRGRVRPERDESTNERYAAAVATEIGWTPVVGHFALYAVDIDDVTYISYVPETGAQHVARWPADVEYVRPTITPTSLAAAEPTRRLLVPVTPEQRPPLRP